MNNLTHLPQELVDLICESLSREDVIHAFESLTLTCSKAGLERLEKFVSDPHCKYFVSKVKKVTIHSLTPYRLKGLAESLTSHAETGNNYL
jgi:hypothetical protein